MGERIKELRSVLRLTQEDFSSRVSLARNTVANYECGRREPNNSVITLICREFDVNEDWLRTGEGDMFIEMPEDEELGRYIGEILAGEDDFIKNLVINYMKLDENNKKIIRDFMKSLG